MARETVARILCLGTLDRGEADLLLEALSDDDRRERMALRSARKTGRLSSRLRPLARLRARWVAGRRGVSRLVEVEPEDLRLGAEGDLGRTAAVTALGEFTARLVPVGAKADGFFAALDEAAGEIASGPRPEVAYRAALWRLLRLAGHAPDLAACPACGVRPVEAFAGGAFGCRECLGGAGGAALGEAARRFLSIAPDVPPAVRARMRLSDPTARALDAFLYAVLEGTAEVRLESRALLRAAGYDRTGE